MAEVRRSPLTGHDVPIRVDGMRNITYFDDLCGQWAVTLEADWPECSILGGRLEIESSRLKEPETRRIFALARSEVWRFNNIQGRVPLFMTFRGAQQRTMPRDADSVILTIEDVRDLASQLTLERKALLTLENLVAAEGEIGSGVEIPYLLSEYPGEAEWSEGQPPSEVGITYGCTATEAPMVYQFLISRGLIAVRGPRTMGSHTRAFVTPEGYARVENLKAGADETSRQAFFVCRFIPELDELFEAVIKPLGVELNCAVQRIKDIHHIDKIDDRICQEIRRSQVVLVDLTEQNFNVAFEAGYALALNKPIVWTTKRTPEGVRMPFDIYTYNCLEWDSSDLVNFREALKFRLMAALQKGARDQSRSAV